jgi:hypothetical protein
MSIAVERTVFATPRAAEFLELRALQAQTGQPVEAFGDVVVKELLDNALDAAETAGRAPVIEIRTLTHNGLTYVTVTDNGCGIKAETVTEICDFTVLVSDKARYRGPTRGAQGNAFKTLLGIPFALDVDEPVVIDSAGVRHELRVSDAAGDVVVDHHTGPGRSSGTAVTVPLPTDLEVDAERWAFGAALVNPSATITAINRAYDDDDDGATFFKSSDRPWSKWTPSAPSSPHWYDPAAFTALVHAYIREIGRTGVDRPLGAFITEFDGLSGSVKQKAIRRSAPGITHLSQLAGRDDVIAALHTAMLTHAKPTPPSRLGAVGPDHYRRLLDDEYGVVRFWYKTTNLVVAGVPWIIEVAVAGTDHPGSTWFGCNHGPAFGDPLGRTWLEAGGVCGYGAERLLTECGSGSRAAVVHVICAATQFVDKGKVALVVPNVVAAAASKALGGATKTLRAEAEQRRKDAARADRAAQRARDEIERIDREDRWSIKDAVFRVMDEAKSAAGRSVAVRTLYYQVRPRIQQYTDRELDYAYFSQQLLPEYQRDIAGLPGVYYEARGELHHPHDGRVIRLGTREVAAYIPPEWQLNTVLYVEKTGLEAQLAPYELGQRFDMGIIYGQGYPVEACRDLLARFEIRDVKIFVLHDGDIDGYGIARTLAEATKRMPNHHIDVIDLGLTVPQAIEYGLETEKFTRKKALSADLALDDDALEWFTGVPIQAGWSKVHYQCRRVELNAFSSDQLAEFIEAGLAAHGAATKLVPPAEVLAEHVQEVRDVALTQLVTRELIRMVDIGAVMRQLLADHPDLIDIDEGRIRDEFTEDPTLSWRSAAQQLVGEDIDAADGLTDAVREQLAEQLRASSNGDTGETGDRDE